MNWLDENVPEQARAMFTTWCFMEDIEADTAKCDNALISLYHETNIGNYGMSYDDFENFMVALIV